MDNQYKLKKMFFSEAGSITGATSVSNVYSTFSNTPYYGYQYEHFKHT